MIEHIVSFKLKDITQFDYVGEEFAKLAKQIPEIEKYTYAKNIYLKRETNFDAIVKVYFKSEADLETYLFNEEHVKFAKNMVANYWEKVITIDVNVE